MTRTAVMAPCGRAVLLSYFLLGAGTLIIWNTFVFAFDYFQAVFHPMYPDMKFASLVSAVYNPCCLLSLLASMSLEHGVSEKLQVRACFGGYFATLVITLAAISFPSLVPVTVLLAVTMGVIAVCGLLTGLIQGALLAEASQLPLAYTQAVVAGTAACGLMVAGLKIATKLALPQTAAGLTQSAIAYFAVALAFTTLCLVIHGCLLPASAFVQWHARERAALRTADITAADERADLLEPLLPEVLHVTLPLEALVREVLPLDSATPGDEQDVSVNPVTAAVTAAHSKADLPHLPLRADLTASPLAGAAACEAAEKTRWDAVLSLWDIAIACFLIYLGTLAIFPGFLIANAGRHARDSDWAAIYVITVFNLGDFISRLMPVPQACFSGGVQVSLNVLRIAFIGVLGRFGAFFFATPASGAIVTLALGCSNGFLTSAAMLAGARQLVGCRHAGAGNNFLVLCLTVGCVVGSYVGLIAF